MIVSPKRFETFPQFHIQSESEKAFLRAKKLRVKPKLLVSTLTQCHSLLTLTQEAHYGLIGPNKHMFESDVSLCCLMLMLLLLTPLSQLMRQYATILDYLGRNEINSQSDKQIGPSYFC